MAPNIQGRVITTRPLPSALCKQKHGTFLSRMMRSMRGWKKLVCFYCNKKSSIADDGTVSAWDCTVCDATNYLDENGRITDPPHLSASQDPAPTPNLSFRVPLTQAPPRTSFWCATCEKNQHLYSSSLAQFYVKIDPEDPDWNRKEQDTYEKFKANLKQRYPQVCEDCEPKLDESLRRAGKTAQADHIKKSLDKTRRNTASRDTSLSAMIIYLGKCLWLSGIIGQILWNLMSAFAIFQHTHCSDNISSIPFGTTFHDRFLPMATSTTWAWCSLSCTILSSWWNPKFRDFSRGWDKHITGFGDWYKLQLITFIVRCIVLCGIMRYKYFADLSAPATMAAHIVFPGFFFLVTIKSKYSLKIDMSALWMPSNLGNRTHVGHRSRSPPQSLQSLKRITTTVKQEWPEGRSAILRSSQPTRSARKGAAQPTHSVYEQMQATRPGYKQTQTPCPEHKQAAIPRDRFSPRPNLSSRRPIKPDISFLPKRTTPALSEMTVNETTNYFKTGEIPLRMQQHQDDGEAMEWSPTRNYSFNASQPFQRRDENLAPIPAANEKPVFWYRVPEAPMTPAQRLRNPRRPYKVDLPESKDSFFKQTNRTQQWDHDDTIRTTENGHVRHNINIAQQKFFPQADACEDLLGLMNTFSDFVVSSSDTDDDQEMAGQSFEAKAVPGFEGRWADQIATSTEPAKAARENSAKKANSSTSHRHAYQSLAVLVGLGLWYHASSYPSDYSSNIMLAVLTGCFALGLRTLFDYTIYAEKSAEHVVRQTIGTCYGGLSLAAAMYGVVEIASGGGGDPQTLGFMYVGAVLVSELYIAMF